MTYIPPGGAVGAPEYQAHARALAGLAARHGFPYVDVLAHFDRHPDARRLYLHPRDGHMSAEGHAIVGGALARAILDGGWLGRLDR